VTAVIEAPPRGPDGSPTAVDAPRAVTTRPTPADVLFRGVLRAGGGTVLVLMLLVGGFLAAGALPALRAAKLDFLTTERWEPDGGTFGIAAVLSGTVIIALVAVTLALPLSIGAALYLSEYAPAAWKRFLVSLVDLMAAVPSVVYGLWGFFLFQPFALGFARWMSTWLGWIPIFSVDGVEPGDPLATETVYKSSAFIAGVVVGLMVTPIATSVMREVFSQAPVGEREGAYALGSTRWGMIRTVVLPFGKGGIIGGMMLALGRSLGETIAVVLIISPAFMFQPHIFEAGTNSVAALIANRYGEASSFATSALMAAGLTLFVMTLVVNFIASTIIARSRSGASSDA
jgi:phosphate transport system permease protein